MKYFIHLADIFCFHIVHCTSMSEMRLGKRSIFRRQPKLLLTVLFAGFTISSQTSESNVLQRDVCMSSNGEEGTETGHIGSPPRLQAFERS